MIISKTKYVGFEPRSYVNQICRIQTMDHVLVEPPAACKNGQSRTNILSLCHKTFTGSQISNLLNLNENEYTISSDEFNRLWEKIRIVIYVWKSLESLQRKAQSVRLQIRRSTDRNQVRNIIVQQKKFWPKGPSWESLSFDKILVLVYKE